MECHDSRLFFFFQAEDGIRDLTVTGVQTCALPIYPAARAQRNARGSLRVRRARDQRPADRGARARKAAAKDELALYRAGAAARNRAGARRMGSRPAQSAGVRL